MSGLVSRGHGLSKYKWLEIPCRAKWTNIIQNVRGMSTQPPTLVVKVKYWSWLVASVETFPEFVLGDRGNVVHRSWLILIICVHIVRERVFNFGCELVVIELLEL